MSKVTLTSYTKYFSVVLDDDDREYLVTEMYDENTGSFSFEVTDEDGNDVSEEIKDELLDVMGDKGV